MARIRSIKPDFWSSEQVMACSRDARLLFIGIWNFADDAGRYLNSPKTVKAQIFPGDDDATASNVRRWLDELSSNGLVLFYESGGKQFLQVTGWKHQKIDRPQEPKYPAPPFDEHSSNDRRAFATDRIGEEGKGEDRKGAGETRAPVASLIEEGWTPDETTIEKAKALGLIRDDLTKMLARFVPHYRARGEYRADWNAQFEAWCVDEAKKLDRKPVSEQRPVKQQFHIKVDTPQWEAWAKHRGRKPPMDANFGWFFDSEWPPGHEGKAA